MTEFISGLVGVALGALIVSWLTLDRQKKQMIWHDKRQTYKEIAEALHRIKSSYIKVLRRKNIDGLPRSLSKTELTELRDNLHGSLIELRKCVDIGGLVIGRSASETLDAFIVEYDRSLDHLNSYDTNVDVRQRGSNVVENEFYEKRISLADDCLMKIKKIYRYDINSPDFA